MDAFNSLGRIIGAVVTLVALMPMFWAVKNMRQAYSPSSSASMNDEDIASSIAAANGSARGRQLKALLAPKGAVTKSASGLTIVAIDFAGRSSERFEPTSAAAEAPGSTTQDAPAAYPLSIDFGDATRRAVVVLSSEAVAPEISATDASSAVGVLGIESKAFPDVSKLKPKMLAGYRIEAAGGASAARPEDPSADSEADSEQFCASVKAWTRHFGLKAADIDFVLFRDPSSLSYDGSKWVSDGREVTRLFDSDIESICAD